MAGKRQPEPTQSVITADQIRITLMGYARNENTRAVWGYTDIVDASHAIVAHVERTLIAHGINLHAEPVDEGDLVNALRVVMDNGAETNYSKARMLVDLLKHRRIKPTREGE